MLRRLNRPLRNVRSASSRTNPFDKILKDTQADGKSAKFFDLTQLGTQYESLPISIRVLAEAAVRNCDNYIVTEKDVNNILGFKTTSRHNIEIPFIPARVILQDFTGVPVIVDLAAMRDATMKLGGDPTKINPNCPVDLVIDHSVQVDHWGSPDAAQKNIDLEMKRNFERFQFLKWGSTAFDNLSIVPPGSGIVHQVNLEYIARVVFNRNGKLYPDSVVGTDSHTTMINGLGVVGWGVGGIEAEAAFLGQPINMLIPKVVGYRLTGNLREGVTATDLVLTITERLRKHGVVGKFVEFFGEGCKKLSLADRATLSNMAPEYGATIGFFPVDDATCFYLRDTGRSTAHVDRVSGYLKAVQMHMDSVNYDKIDYSEVLDLDLGEVEPSLAGPKRPEDRVPLKNMQTDFRECMAAANGHKGFGIPKADRDKSVTVAVNGKDNELKHGAVVIAAITSCTNTSNPGVIMAAGLVAKKAVEKGLTVQSSVKTSLSPGSGVVREYLRISGLQESLNKLGFDIAGYGCMTCIGNSGDLDETLTEKIKEQNLVTAAVLSGNRNFEARIHPNVASAYLASPPLVVAYALAGTVDINLTTDPIGKDKNGNAVYLRDIWPSQAEIASHVEKFLKPDMYQNIYSTIKEHNKQWNDIEVQGGSIYTWTDSTYIHKPPFFDDMTIEPKPSGKIENARCLLMLGDSINTDTISPAGRIAKGSPAGEWLESHGVERNDWNTYGSRRGNDLIMARGTFANVRLTNKLLTQTGPFTKFHPTGETKRIFDAVQEYKQQNIPLIVLAGKMYGCGSSRDWAAKGTLLLGIRAVIAESYERIHRSNLVGMGIIPLQFKEGQDYESLGLKGTESFTIDLGDPNSIVPGQEVAVLVNGGETAFRTVLRFDTPIEVDYYRHGGILNYVLRQKILGAEQE